MEKQERIFSLRFMYPDLLILAITVANLEMHFSTAVFECFSDQIAVAWADFAKFDCCWAIKKQQKLQYYLKFLLIRLSVQENHLLQRQYNKCLSIIVLSFFVASAVVEQKSLFCTVANFLVLQFKNDYSCFLLSPRQSQAKKGRRNSMQQPFTIFLYVLRVSPLAAEPYRALL